MCVAVLAEFRSTITVQILQENPLHRIAMNKGIRVAKRERRSEEGEGSDAISARPE